MLASYEWRHIHVFCFLKQIITSLVAKRIEMSSLRFWRLKSVSPGRHWQGRDSSEAIRRTVPCFFQLLGGCWNSLALPKPLQSPPPSSCLLLCAGQVSLCLFRKRIQLIVLRAHKGNQGRSCHVKILNFITYPKIFYIRFPQKVTFTGSRMRTWISFGVCFQPAT